MVKIAKITLFTLLAVGCQKSQKIDRNSLSNDDASVSIDVNFYDLKLFKPLDFTTELDCGDIDSAIDGQVLITPDYKSLTLVFNPGQNAIVGKNCQVKVFGEPRAQALVEFLSEPKVDGLLMISKPAPVMPGTLNSQGQVESSLTTIFMKTYRSKGIVPDILLEPSPVIVKAEEDLDADPEDQPGTDPSL